MLGPSGVGAEDSPLMPAKCKTEEIRIRGGRRCPLHERGTNLDSQNLHYRLFISIVKAQGPRIYRMVAMLSFSVGGKNLMQRNL